MLRSVEPHGFVPEGSEVTEIPPGSAPKIKDGIRSIALYRIEECGMILADVVVSCAVPESLGEPIIICDRRVRDAPDLFCVISFGDAAHDRCYSPIFKSSACPPLKGGPVTRPVEHQKIARLWCRS